MCACRQASLHHGCVCVRVCSDVLQVLLDAPQSVSALLELGHLGVRQGHVDDAAHTGVVQHAGQRQEDLLTNTIHVLQKYKQTHTGFGKEALPNIRRKIITKTQFIGI